MLLLPLRTTDTSLFFLYRDGRQTGLKLDHRTEDGPQLPLIMHVMATSCFEPFAS
jgi:hypothetical protein